MQKTFNFFYAFLLALLGIGATLIAEEITLTTYYPAPYGAYEELSTTGNTYLATSSGNVGIGTDSPVEKLDVDGHIKIGNYSVAIRKVESSPWVSDVRFTSTGSISAADGLYFIIDDDGSSTNEKFYFAKDGQSRSTPDQLTRLMVIDESGSVGIGTTDPGTYKCYINGTGYLNAAAWVYGSDVQLKENIDYIQSGLNIIEQLKPVKFDYIDGDKRQVGFVAQEVREVLPDIVVEGPDGLLGMRVDSVIPYLVKALQEQQREIEVLKARLNAME